MGILKKKLKLLKKKKKEPVRVFRPIKLYLGNSYFVRVAESGEAKPEGIIIDVYKIVPNEDGEKLMESYTYWYNAK